MILIQEVFVNVKISPGGSVWLATPCCTGEDNWPKRKYSVPSALSLRPCTSQVVRPPGRGPLYPKVGGIERGDDGGGAYSVL